MAVYDPETFRDDLLAVIKANLDDKVAAINAEKGDSLLETFADEQYVIDFNEQVVNYDSFLFYGFMDITTPESNPAAYSEEVTLFFSAFFIETEGGLIAENKVLRYTRAFSEILTENGQSASYSNLEIQTLAPVAVEINNMSNWFKAGGIQVKGTLG